LIPKLSGYCAPVDPSNACKIIRGYTGIRLDNNTTTVEIVAFDAIQQALNEPLSLSQFATISFASIDFVRMVRSSVIQLSNHGSRRGISASKLAIASAVVTFALTAIFLARLIRTKRRDEAVVKERKQVEPPGRKRFLLGGAPRTYFELDEDQETGSGFNVIESIMENPSVTWSVSDITSESGSISLLSSMSKATSTKLDVIDEADDEGQADCEWDGSDTLECCNVVALESSGDGPPTRLHIAQWDIDVYTDAMDEVTEPEGCQYLEDRGDVEGYYIACFGEPEEEEEEFGSDEYALVSMLDISESSDETVEASNETRAVLYACSWNAIEVDDEAVQKWMVMLLKALRSAQHRKLITNLPQE